MLVPGPAPAVISAPAPGSVPAATDTVLLPAGDDGVEMVARFFRALADPARLRLLEFLLPGERTVTECVAHVGLSQGRVSAHLACLAGCGYVQARRAGRNAFYRVADPRVADLVVLARSMAADNAAALAACVYIAPPSPGQGTAAGS
jgi:ArsR family transcriptional regulator, cadmium/lead-responsive transcriptional repressor